MAQFHCFWSVRLGFPRCKVERYRKCLRGGFDSAHFVGKFILRLLLILVRNQERERFELRLQTIPHFFLSWLGACGINSRASSKSGICSLLSLYYIYYYNNYIWS
jgi:hypothetical protein